MEYVYPDYYRQFTCIGGECPDTCCAGWEIVIDDKSLEKYRAYPGGFGNRLRNSINFKRKSFKQYDRRCAFLNEENLCDIYTEAGEKMFCKHADSIRGMKKNMKMSGNCHCLCHARRQRG